MLKVIAACGSGMGSSQIIKMKIDKAFKSFGIDVSIHHCSVGEAKTQINNYDVVFCSAALESNFKSAKEKGKTVIPLRNVLSEAEIKEKIQSHIIDKQ
ncbi:MAG: PTS ascorbate transporter subunit IIB [Epulopiscium sp. Nele67-Bin002]|nr:MAG: PTS ascorbate transporter subunit IIB [Epulopiscium sp. Nuni2H_MBin001]OON92198.1 MAG: PTS ascorbate transporter subunit IIB [Epulopiscium sp. Nele67-Bin002]